MSKQQWDAPTIVEIKDAEDATSTTDGQYCAQHDTINTQCCYYGGCS